MPNFEKLLMAVTRNGQLTPAHFRAWADHAEIYVISGKLFSIPGWLRELADSLEEIYAEVIEKYKEE